MRRTRAGLPPVARWPRPLELCARRPGGRPLVAGWLRPPGLCVRRRGVRLLVARWLRPLGLCAPRPGGWSLVAGWLRPLPVLALLLASLLAGGAQAAPPPDRLAALRQGIALTGWFRYPASLDPAALRHWIGDGAIAALHRAGFGFVRLAVDPAVLSAPGVPLALSEAIARLQRFGLTVVVSLHPVDWHLETESADQARLFAAWRSLAPLLAQRGARQTVAELLNEPVFPGDPGGWQRLQHQLLEAVRRTLPEHTIVLTGNDWGSVGGLLASLPEADANVLYSVHLYEPAELTSLAAWRPGLDREALGRLPFPAADAAACRVMADRTDAETAGVIRFYCAQHWDDARVAARLDAAAAWGRRHQAALLLGEFGASAALNPVARLAWLGGVRRSAAAAGMGWALWGYDDVMGLAVRRPPGADPVLDAGVLRALGLRAPD